MNIEITCPECNFSKSVPEDKIPGNVRWVVCPGCRNRFEFTPVKPVAADSENNSPAKTRDERGILKGIFKTITSVLFTPGRFFTGENPGKGIREPLAFGLLVGGLGYMMGLFWNFLPVACGMIPYSSYISNQISVSTLFLVLMILSPLLVIINIFFTSAVIHLLMLVINGGKGGFEATFRVIAFSEATWALAFIPVIGVFTGLCWNIVITVTGLREIHRTSYVKVIAAVIASMIIKWLLPVFLLGVLIKTSGLL